MFKIIFLVLIVTIGYSCSEAEYKLSYFDLRGRGEFIRFIFAAANQKYQDDRISLSEWNDFKSNTPFNQLPILEIHQESETVVLAQSKAIGKQLILYLILLILSKLVFWLKDLALMVQTKLKKL